jgi:hypothetical protein
MSDPAKARELVKQLRHISSHPQDSYSLLRLMEAADMIEELSKLLPEPKIPSPEEIVVRAANAFLGCDENEGLAREIMARIGKAGCEIVRRGEAHCELPEPDDRVLDMMADSLAFDGWSRPPASPMRRAFSVYRQWAQEQRNGRA